MWLKKKAYLVYSITLFGVATLGEGYIYYIRWKLDYEDSFMIFFTQYLL